MSLLATSTRIFGCGRLAQCDPRSSLVSLQAALGLATPTSLCTALSRSFSTYESPQLNLVPMVIERTQRGERSFDIFSRLLRERIVSLTGPINDNLSHLIVAQLLYLESEAPEKPVSLISPAATCL